MFEYLNARTDMVGFNALFYSRSPNEKYECLRQDVGYLNGEERERERGREKI
jgi:hypothetical protein